VFIKRIWVAKAVRPQVHRHDVDANSRLVAIQLNHKTARKVLGSSETSETLAVTLGNLGRAGNHRVIRPGNRTVVCKYGLHLFNRKILVINQLKILCDQFG
jgi:hypothetical protein